MSIPIFCEKCGKIIGEDNFNNYDSYMIKTPYSKKHGICNHPKEKRVIINTMFNTTKKHLTYYPETDTYSEYFEYQGPKIKFLLIIFMIFLGIESIYTKNGWIFFDNNLYGDGLDYFK